MQPTATAATAPTTTAPAAAVQARYAQRVKARLDRPVIAIADARDGIVDCFIATYFQGVALGLKSLVAIDGTDDDVARVTAAMFRRRLRQHGVSFEAPTIEALTAVKDEVDRELHFGELPADLRAVHDQVCTLLLAKADGTMPHQPGRSAVEPSASAPPSPSATTIAAPSPVPAPPVPPTAPRAPAPTPATAPVTVADELRRTIERHLIEVGRAATTGATTAALRARLAQAEALLVALDAFAPPR